MKSTKMNNTVIDRIDKAIADLKNNNFTIYFFIADCKNVPNSSMEYIRNGENSQG